MKYKVMDPRYVSDRETNPMFTSNDKKEAIIVADEIGSGTVVVRIDESGAKEIVYTAAYQTDLGLFE